jgi:hypothetical protein
MCVGAWLEFFIEEGPFAKFAAAFIKLQSGHGAHECNAINSRLPSLCS